MLKGYAAGWDALAVERRRPRSAPAWSLAWYRHALPTGALIRALVVTEGTAVIAVVPFFVVRTGFGFYRYEPAAPELHGVEPLCAAGRDEEAGEAIATALATCDPLPDIVSLDWLPAGSPLPQLVRSAWPRPRPAIIRKSTPSRRHAWSWLAAISSSGSGTVRGTFVSCFVLPFANWRRRASSTSS